MRLIRAFAVLTFLVLPLSGCAPAETPTPGTAGSESSGAPSAEAQKAVDAIPTITPELTLTRDQTHNRFSAAIPPIARVEPGTVLQVETEEASDGQLTPDSTVADLATLDFDPIHPLTGPVYVEGAAPGDVLKVTLHSIELGGWGWNASIPGFGFLADEYPDPLLKTFLFEPGQSSVEFVPGFQVPLNPFPGVLGVAPATEEMLTTIPPRANGGNMDDRDITAGTTVYLPVFVEGALFSIGDTHAAQGDGEVCGSAIEAPTTIVLELDVIKGGRSIEEPQYERADFYAVTAFAPTIDEAAKKATGFMVDYLVDAHGLSREDAYMLASVAANLKIAEVVDVPHMLVTMQIAKSVLPKS